MAETKKKSSRSHIKRKSFELDSLELCLSILRQVLHEEPTPRSLIETQMERLSRRIDFLYKPQGFLFGEIERLRLEGKNWECIAEEFNESGKKVLLPPRGSSWTGCNIRMWYTRYLDKHRGQL